MHFPSRRPRQMNRGLPRIRSICLETSTIFFREASAARLRQHVLMGSVRSESQPFGYARETGCTHRRVRRRCLSTSATAGARGVGNAIDVCVSRSTSDKASTANTADNSASASAACISNFVVASNACRWWLHTSGWSLVQLR
jgi:hypothetical protein